MNKSREEYKLKFRNFEQLFKQKLFLASFDLMSLNVSSRLLYQLFLLIDFLFLAAYPLDQIYNRSKSSLLTSGSYTKDTIGKVVSYLNPTDILYNSLSYDSDKKVAISLIVYTSFVTILLSALVLSRNKKKLSISSQTKLTNKVVGSILSLNNFCLFIPFVSFLAKLCECNKEETECFKSSHLAIICFSVLAILQCVILSYFSHSMMTSCYPNENIPWSHFPSRQPYVKVLFRLAVILAYQVDAQREVTMYFNGLFCLIQLAFLYHRLTNSMTFDRFIHKIDTISDSVLLVFFFAAFVCDLINTHIDGLFSLALVFSVLGLSLFALMIQNQYRERFLQKIDIFNYRYEFDALHMMIALHELIEMSQFDDHQDFLLRGFIERHIEICDFPECNCIEYYKIINSYYRIQLAKIATMKEDENNKSSSMNNTYNKKGTTPEEETTQDDSSVQKTFFVQSKNMVKQNKARTKFMNTFLINNIKVFLELFPNSVKLRYMSAFIYFNMFKNSFKALYELSYTKTLKSSFGDSYDSYTLGLKIIQYFMSRVNSFLSKENKILDLEIDLKQIIEFEKLNIKYQKSIEQTSEVAEVFWLELNKKNINVDNIFRYGSTINSQFYKIKKKYKKLMSINSNYLEVAYLYKLFVSLCLNYELEETEAKMEITKILQAKGMRKKNLRQEYCRINFSDENGMIIISGCQKDFSKILAMNNKAERIFGYNTDELINHPMTKLQPMVYGFSHDDFILNYINAKRKINKEVHNFVWGKHKSGFIMPLVMDISPYVTFEYNLCFIAFTKRSILLEMNPLKEILDAQDVFVLLADQKGIITDMTRNITEWLGFPLQALNKDITLEQIFDGILEDELEKKFQEGNRIDFFMNSFKDALDDFENRSEDDFESTLCMKEKKCRALVWMKIHEHQLALHSSYQNPSAVAVPGSGVIGTMGGSSVVAAQTAHPNSVLVVREIWFVLLEEEAATATATASFLDTKNTHESALEKEELKFTYQEDREEICSLASVSSLAGYGSSDKGLINKLSEIKTSTIDQQKPRSISLLQKVLVLAFIISVFSAVVMLVFAMFKDQSFFSQLETINKAKISAISLKNLQIITRELVNIANGYEDDEIDFISQKVSSFLQANLLQDVEKFRSLQNDIEIQQHQYSLLNNFEDTETFKLQNLSVDYLRADCSHYSQTKTYSLAFYELLTLTQQVGELSDISIMNISRQAFDKAQSGNSTSNKACILTEFQREIYFLLSNSISPSLNYYSFKQTDDYIAKSKEGVTQNKTLFLSITVVSIAIILLTAWLMIPIILRIESNKEKVFFIYAELSKNDVDDRKRNIRIFFAKLRQSTNNPGGSLFYQKSSRIVSSRLVSKKFSMEGEGNNMASFALTRQSQAKDGSQSNGMDKNQVDMEEDMRAEILKQQEDLEAAVFKKFFHSKIKQMSCIKKFKFILLVLFLAGLVQGYFILAQQLISTSDDSVNQSLNLYQIISSRDPLLSELISYYRESVARNFTIPMRPGDFDGSSNFTWVSSVNYFIEKNLNNEKQYNQLRVSLPSLLSQSADLIKHIESDQFCSFNLSSSNQDICESALNGLLKTGMTQTINTVIQDIIQSQINFDKVRYSEAGLNSQLNDNTFRSLIYLKLMFLDDAFISLIKSTSDSIVSQFKTMQRSIIIAFACFLLVMIVGVGISSTWGMNFLFKHFNATKGILNLIPGKCLLELSDRIDLKKIQF